MNAGRPGSVGDSYTYRHSLLYQKIANGEWLSHSPRVIEGVAVKPFLVADAAFPLESTCMKCFDTGIVPQKQSFNYSLIRIRRVASRRAFWHTKESMEGDGWPVQSEQSSVCAESGNGLLCLAQCM